MTDTCNNGKLGFPVLRKPHQELLKRLFKVKNNGLNYYSTSLYFVFMQLYMHVTLRNNLSMCIICCTCISCLLLLCANVFFSSLTFSCCWVDPARSTLWVCPFIIITQLIKHGTLYRVSRATISTWTTCTKHVHPSLVWTCLLEGTMTTCRIHYKSVYCIFIT